MIAFEELKHRAAKVAAEKRIPPELATLGLVHGIGHENVDFSGGRRATPDDGTIPLATTQQS